MFSVWTLGSTSGNHGDADIGLELELPHELQVFVVLRECRDHFIRDLFDEK